MAATTTMKNNILTNVFRTTGSLFIGLSKTAPNENGGNVTEPTSPSYERLEVLCTSDNWGEPANGSISNATALRFAEAQESWTSAAAPITHWVIYDAKTSGNMLFYGDLMAAREIPTGSIFEITQESLVTTILND